MIITNIIDVIIIKYNTQTKLLCFENSLFLI
jgi:hypothetical protein